MITLPDIRTQNPQLRETSYGVNSLGLVIPFQPSMVDVKTIHGILNYTLEVVQAKLESTSATEDDIKFVIDRLEKIFSKLNYDSHRKSVAIIINGEEEKIIYLNYSGKPVFFRDAPFSLLDLVGESVRTAEFELIILRKNTAELYEYFNNGLHKVFAQSPDACTEPTGDNGCLIQRIATILKLVNKNNDKPVFIYADDDQQTNKFFEFFPYKEIAFTINLSSSQDNGKITHLLVEKITRHWSLWQSKLVKGQIAIAKKYQVLFSHLNSVINALKHSNNGLLLIDSFLKEEIHKTLENESLFAATEKLTAEIEKFLARGNRIEITEGGLLETLGGIALIKDQNSQYQSFRYNRTYKEEDFMT